MRQYMGIYSVLSRHQIYDAKLIFHVGEVDGNHIRSIIKELFIGPLSERFAGANDLRVAEP